MATPSASAVILPPTTIDGPNTEALSLEDVAMAPDGTGAVVYTKAVSGVPHVFVSRYDGSNWSAPIRVDWEIPYEASQPRIAAERGGRLLVVWVTQVATLADGQIRMGLYSASLGGGSGGFGSALLVDPNVGKGAGVTPSLAGAAPGRAIVAYRVVTMTFELPVEAKTAVQLHPGDVMAEIRVARLEGDRWSRRGPINRAPALSMRPPNEENGPKVAIGGTGRAVVAWQEPDLTGVARVWIRRISGTTLGPIFAASPGTWNGKPVSEDATATGLAVASYDRARVAVRVDGAAASPQRGQRIFLTSLGPSDSPEGGKPLGPESIDGEAVPALPAPVGQPAVAADEAGGAAGSLRLAFTAGTHLWLVLLDEEGKLLPPERLAGPPAQPASPAVAAIGSEGGGVVAYQATGGERAPAVAVHQEFPRGGWQTGLLFGPVGGAVSQLAGDGSNSGDALLAFRQGESGRFAIVADRVAAPPAKFRVGVPDRWVRPRRAKVRWQAPPSAVGGIVYGLLVDGRMVRSGLRRREVVPPTAVLGSGAHRVQVLARDRLGGETLSRPARLRVDGQAPRLRVRLNRRRGLIRLRLSDAQSGLRRRAVGVGFGDGEWARGGKSVRAKRPCGKRGGHRRNRAKRPCGSRPRALIFSHGYSRPGRFTVRVHAADRVGNRLLQRVQVEVR